MVALFPRSKAFLPSAAEEDGRDAKNRWTEQQINAYLDGTLGADCPRPSPLLSEGWAGYISGGCPALPWPCPALPFPAGRAPLATHAALLDRRRRRSPLLVVPGP